MTIHRAGHDRPLHSISFTLYDSRSTIYDYMLSARLESLLFVAGKSLSLSALAKLLEAKTEEVKAALEVLIRTRNLPESGIHILEHEGQWQCVTNPVCADTVQKLAKEEVDGELTRPSLETLTIIGYRGPITKPEIEQIRGVNCTLILRNLLVRGLINEEEDRTRLQMVYTVSTDFLRQMGLHHVNELPDYEAIRHHEKIDDMLRVINGDISSATV